MNRYNCLLIGIAGGTGAGKTTLAEELQYRLGKEKVTIIPQDAYYKDRSHLPRKERQKVNYDLPNAFENDLLVEHLQKIQNFEPIERPIYNFTTHTRKKRTISVKPIPIVIVEGIMVLVDEKLRSLFDFKIFVETDSDVRVIRRFERDINERGRSFDSVKEQYLETVRPMHLTFVELSKQYADIIITEGCKEATLNKLVKKLQKHLDQDKPCQKYP